MEKRGNVQRAKKERAVLAKLKAHTGEPLPFRRLTLPMLHAWEIFLITEKKNKASTVQAAMTVVRLHVNRAIRAGLMDASASPFIAYKAPKVLAPTRTKLTAEEIGRIEGLNLGLRGPRGSGQAKVRDWFLFSFYAAGMRFSDVMQLRRSDVAAEVDGEGGTFYPVRYRMGKTGKRADVMLVPQALAIIEPYLDRPAEGYLFDALAREGLGVPEGSGVASGSGPCLGFDVATVARARLGMDEAAAFDALRALASHELATVQDEVGPGATVTLHPESRSWF